MPRVRGVRAPPSLAEPSGRDVGGCVGLEWIFVKQEVNQVSTTEFTETFMSQVLCFQLWEVHQFCMEKTSPLKWEDRTRT